MTPPHHPLAGATLAHEPGGGLRVIPAYVAIYERRAGGETPQHEKLEKRKDPHGKGGRLPLDPGGRGRWGPRGTWGSLGPIVLQIALFAPCKRAPRRRTASGGA